MGLFVGVKGFEPPNPKDQIVPMERIELSKLPVIGKSFFSRLHCITVWRNSPSLPHSHIIVHLMELESITPTLKV